MTNERMLEIKAVFDELASSASMLYKKDVLKKNENDQEFKKILTFLLDPFLITGISVKKIGKQVAKDATHEFDSFIELMEYLFSHNTGTDEIIADIQRFLCGKPDELAEFYKAVIIKSLRIGCDVKTVNKVYGAGFIPEWQVQQSYGIKESTLGEGEWFSLSEKLNGVRGTYISGKILSRQGKEFSGLGHIIADLEGLSFQDMVFDGELIRKNSDNVSDNQNFRLGTGILNSDDQDKSAIMFVIFDMLPRQEFEKGQSNLTYRDRLADLRDMQRQIEEKRLECINLVRILYEGSDRAEIDNLLEEMVAEDKEGLMLNRDSKYYCKRHNGIVKVKRFYTVDLEVVRVEEGTGRLSGVLGAFVVLYKGGEVNVGSGMTDEQRKEYWDMRGELAGRVVEVKYKEESHDKKTGKSSLQFPIFVALREHGKEPSLH